MVVGGTRSRMHGLLIHGAFGNPTHSKCHLKTGNFLFLLHTYTQLLYINGCRCCAHVLLNVQCKIMCSWSYTVNTKNNLRGRVVAVVVLLVANTLVTAGIIKLYAAKLWCFVGCFVARKWNIWNGREIFWMCSEMEVLVYGTTQVCWLQFLALGKVCSI